MSLSNRSFPWIIGIWKDTNDEETEGGEEESEEDLVPDEPPQGADDYSHNDNVNQKKVLKLRFRIQIWVKEEDSK